MAIVAVLAIVAAEVSANGIPKEASKKNPMCPSAGTARIPHPMECTLYYICQDGEATISSCPEGLHFNKVIKQCDWPPAGCFPKNAGTNWPETQPIIPDEEEAKSSSSIPTYLGCIGTCPLPDPIDRTIQLPYRDDCTKFCTCSNGTPYLMSCPAGLHFDTKVSVCNWPWRARCRW